MGCEIRERLVDKETCMIVASLTEIYSSVVLTLIWKEHLTLAGSQKIGAKDYVFWLSKRNGKGQSLTLQQSLPFSLSVKALYMKLECNDLRYMYDIKIAPSTHLLLEHSRLEANESLWKRKWPQYHLLGLDSNATILKSFQPFHYGQSGTHSE